jgi:hypothetical protein
MPSMKLTPALLKLIERRGRKTLRSADRYRALLRLALAEGCEDRVGGPSPGGAAGELGMSRQAVHRAISRGTLDAWYVPDGKEFYVYVTEESIKRYKKSGRRRA